MVDIAALMRMLPVSALGPDWVASFGGFIDVPKDRREERVGLLEPPAGQRVPYIEPVNALEKLLRRRGVAPEGAKVRALDNPFLRWREAIRPVAHELEKALSEPVYHFADLDCDTDDDDVHRFLVLVGLEASGCGDRIDYLPSETRKSVGMVFLTEAAREVAFTLLMQQIGAHAFIVAPKELATDAWVKQATRYCRDWTVRYVYDGKLDDPIDILAAVDSLHVVANGPTPKSGFDLKLSEPVGDLLWLAFGLGVEAKYYHVERAIDESRYLPAKARRTRTGGGAAGTTCGIHPTTQGSPAGQRLWQQRPVG